MTHFDAEIVLMSPVIIGQRQDCWIFNDNLKTGNHPFPNGKWVNTSAVDEDFVDESGQRFLKTRSKTIYKVLGEGMDDARGKVNQMNTMPRVVLP